MNLGLYCFRTEWFPTNPDAIQLPVFPNAINLIIPDSSEKSNNDYYYQQVITFTKNKSS